MKVTIKNREFELNDFAHVAWIVKAICHPERLKLILFMEKNERYTVNDLIPVIGKPQPFVSQHLSFLKKQGLVTLEREAQFHYFQINKPLLELVKWCFYWFNFHPEYNQPALEQWTTLPPNWMVKTFNCMKSDIRQRLVSYVAQNENIAATDLKNHFWGEQASEKGAGGNILKEMKDAEILMMKKDGQRRLYSVNYERLKFLHLFYEVLTKNIDSLTQITAKKELLATLVIQHNLAFMYGSKHPIVKAFKEEKEKLTVMSNPVRDNHTFNYDY